MYLIFLVYDIISYVFLAKKIYLIVFNRTYLKSINILYDTTYFTNTLPSYCLIEGVHPIIIVCIK